MRNNLRAAVLSGPQSITVETRNAPEIGANQVRVRLEGCGVCGSNLPVWEGRPWFNYPLEPGAPGHEGWGRIESIGSEVEGYRPGDRVALLSYNAFAEQDIADTNHIIPLPPALDGQPFPGEALGCAMNVFARSDIRAGQTVAIVGIGFLGALLVDLAVRAGASVIAISRRPFALEIASRLGARVSLGLDDPKKTIADVLDLTSGAGCPRVIEATGLQQPLDLATEITAERGRLIIAGYHQDGPRQINLQLWNWRGLDVINAHERDPRVYLDGMRAAAAAVAEGRLNPEPLYTDRFPLEDLPTAFHRMRDRDGRFLKALLSYA
jgi:threonine dehydrogenase-like Zn-dependent dehydrogenase